MGRFSDSLKKSPKIRNHRASRSAKIDIRQRVLDAVGTDAHVFDAFAGTGEMYREVWSKAAGYVGCDKDWMRDNRLAYVADNRRVLRCLDMSKFNIVDLDAFGSPYEQALIVADRRPVATGELFGLVLTDGSGMAMKQGGLPKALAYLAGLRQRMSGLARWQDDITERAILGLVKRMNCVVERRWQATGKTGVGVRYIGLVLRGR